MKTKNKRKRAKRPRSFYVEIGTKGGLSRKRDADYAEMGRRGMERRWGKVIHRDGLHRGGEPVTMEALE